MDAGSVLYIAIYCQVLNMQRIFQDYWCLIDNCFLKSRLKGMANFYCQSPSIKLPPSLNVRFPLNSEAAEPGCCAPSYQAFPNGIVECGQDFTTHTKQSKSLGKLAHKILT